jgi:acetylglutamate kinase
MHMLHKFASPGRAGRLVIKLGGAALGPTDEAAVLDDLASHRRGGWEIVLVHGGGPEIDRELAARGLGSQRINGLRVTDAATLGVVEATLCGTLNKRLVRALSARGIAAAGISGQDGATLVARRHAPENGADLGYVGEIVQVDPRLAIALVAAGYVPVIAPLAVSPDRATALNVNADSAAGSIATALEADALIIVTDVPRVLRNPSDPTSGIESLDLDEARAFARGDGCQGSMRPKIEAAIAAVEGGVGVACIAAARAGSIGLALDGDATRVASAASASKSAV